MRPPLYICGATASGKSSLAMKLANKLDGEIINADAYQIYQGLEVLTACPTLEERSGCVHHLYATLPLTTELNANYYRQLALPIIQEIQERGKLPIVTGGSGMYLKFLTHGPSPIPASDPDVRASLEARSPEELMGELKRCDPEVLATFPPENTRYLIRALEIYLMTGKKASDLKKDWDTLPTPAPRGILLAPSKQETLDAITERSRMMLDSGAVDEVRNLPALEGLPTAGKAIGVREIRSYLSGEMTREQCEERLIISTRQYAKRQRNWFRNEKWLELLLPAQIDEYLMKQAF